MISANIMAEYLLKNGSEVENMLYFEWSQEEAEEYAEKRGRAEERVEMIRKFSSKLSADDIAETLHVPKEYVLDVLKDDGSMVVAEPSHSYTSCRKE